jgi:uncharacterized protein involved in exopolysaccharide biosynthesis
MSYEYSVPSTTLVNPTQQSPYGLITVLFKHRKLVQRIFLAVLFCGLVYLVFAQRKYESVAELVVRFNNQSVAEVDRGAVTQLTPSDRREIVLSHSQILNSPDLAQATIKAVGLKDLYPDLYDDDEPESASAMYEATQRFINNLYVNVGTQDNVITISFMHPKKDMAQKTLQTLIGLYNGQQTVVYHDPHSQFLQSEVTEASKRLSTAQAALDQFQGQWKISNYNEEIENLIKQRGEVDSSLHVAKSNLELAKHKKEDLERLMRDVPKTVPESAGGEKYRSLDDAQIRLADLQNKRSQMMATYKANAPALISLNAGIRAAEQELASRQQVLDKRSSSNVNVVYQTMQTDYLRASADAGANIEPVQVLTQQRDAIDQRLEDLRKSRTEFDNRVRERALAEDIYKSLSTQFEDARVKDSLNLQRISSAAIISQPSLPYKSARPRSLVTLLATLFAAAIFAIAGALLRESTDDRITTAEQLEGIVGLPVLSTLGYRRRTFTRLLASPEAAT